MLRPIFRRAMGATAVIAIAAMTAACGQQANDSQMTAATTLPELPATLPLDAAAPTNWPTAPEVAALSDARPLRSVRVANPGDDYGYADAAYDFTDVLGDAPPDYYFDYDGVDPWAWEGNDQSVVFVEPIDDGYRYYYYRPGADAPYFVRDPDYGYGYDGDGLAVIYDSYGAVVPYDRYGANRDYAARYYARGRDMYAVSRRGDRRGVNPTIWAARQPAIFAARDRWNGARERQPQWREFHDRAASRQATYWREEATRRQADTRRFGEWRAQSFRTPAPPRAIPAAWSNARWARDDAKFRPARAERVAAAVPQPQPRPDVGPQRALGGKGPDRVAFNDRGNRAGSDPRIAIDSTRPDRRMPNAGPMRVAREAQGRPQPGNQPAPAVAASADRQPERGRNRMMAAPRPERANPGNASRFQPQADRPRPERGGGNRPQFTAPQPQPRPAMAPQRQPRAESPRPQFQPQPRAPQAAPAPQQPRGNSGGGGGGGGGGRGNGGGGGGKGNGGGKRGG
ncbi:hypothetical protein FPZ24_02560 [Sphingomonas panacisoli]|uniref:Uncharacterized protein n=1 Tax=Sphingomonas panacisoli TaxID=1813879 RepID=A0A5B8LEK5_9SPHN|nr:hypothetical protein [Sphingomonas panacisoli]QDZ06493.1 hypothetical protein FPZ24_02560 [Sphingomonas panacisoli]